MSLNLKNSHTTNYVTKPQILKIVSTSYVCAVCQIDLATESELQIHRMIHIERGKNPQHRDVDRESSSLSNSSSSEAVSFNSRGNDDSDNIKTRIDFTFVCEFCGIGFFNENSFWGHHQTHTKKQLTCDVCQKCYTSSSTLKNHMKSHANENASMCHTCEKSFTTKKGLAKHNKVIHTDQKTYVCDFCEKVFARNNELKRHYKIHVGECHIKKLFTCDICQKSYASNSTLENHMILHAKENAHTCEKSFNTDNGLAKHNRVVHADKTPYVCDFCDKVFVKNHELKRHHKIHVGEQSYACKICHGKFTTIWLYNKHVLTHKNNQFSCVVCAKMFNTQKNLRVHLKLHSGVKPFECDVCHKKFALKKYLVRHRQIHADEKPHLCFICKKRFRFKQSLTEHIRIHTGEKPLVCNICSQSFRHSSSLHIHRLRHANSFRHECEVCHKKFIKKNELTSHFVIHTKKSEKPFVCSLCPKSFKLSKSLKTHFLKHVDNRKHTCDICQKKFFAECNLRKHYKFHVDKKEDKFNKLNQTNKQTNKKYNLVKLVAPRYMDQEPTTDERPFVCNICKKRFSNKKYLGSHIVRHGVRKFVCEICKKGFFTKCELKCHQKLHIGEKIYACDVCGKKYIYRNNLRYHVFSKHHRVSKHVCEFCEKHFFHKHELQTHRSSHTGEKPFVCNICGMGISSNSSLRRHHLTHDEKKYSCEICDKSYYRVHSLQAHHIRNHTPGETVCKDCDQIFPDNRSLKEHRNSLHRTHICYVCHMGFSEKRRLQIHQLIHKEKLHVCVVCGKGFNQRHYLMRHLVVHMEVRPHVCHVCNKSFTCKRNFERHYSQIHLNQKDEVRGTHFCHLCKKSFLLEPNLQKHLKTHSSPKPQSIPHICHVCNKSFKCKRNLERHYSNIHLNENNEVRGTHVCHLCKKSFLLKLHLRKHLKTHSSLNSHICLYCNKGFTVKSSLWRHQRNQHKLPQDNHICHICKRGFPTELARKIHQRKAHDFVEAIVSQKEKKIITEKASLKKNNRRKTTFKQTSIKYPCPHCKIIFRSQKFLNKHQNNKHFTFHCSYCAKRFLNSEAVKIHYFKAHSNGKTIVACKNPSQKQQNDNTNGKYVCCVCHEKFTGKVKLWKHRQLHKAEDQLSVNSGLHNKQEHASDFATLKIDGSFKDAGEQLHEANIFPIDCDKELQGNANKNKYDMEFERYNVSPKDVDKQFCETNISQNDCEERLQENDAHQTDTEFEMVGSSKDVGKELHEANIFPKHCDEELQGNADKNKYDMEFERYSVSPKDVDKQFCETNISKKYCDERLQENDAHQTDKEFERDNFCPKDIPNKSVQSCESDVCDNDSHAPQKNTLYTKDVNTQLYVSQKKFARKTYLKQHSHLHEAEKELLAHKKSMSSISSYNEHVFDSYEKVFDDKFKSNIIPPSNPNKKIYKANTSQKDNAKKLQSDGFPKKVDETFEIDVSSNDTGKKSHQNDIFKKKTKKQLHENKVSHNKSDQTHKNIDSIKNCDTQLYENNSSLTDANESNITFNDSCEHTFESNISTNDSVKQLNVSYIYQKASNDNQLYGSKGSEEEHATKSKDSKGRAKRCKNAAFSKDKQAPIKSSLFDDSKKLVHKKHNISKKSYQQLQKSNSLPTPKVKPHTYNSTNLKYNLKSCNKKLERQNPHVCLVCGKMFFEEQFLKKHLVVHAEKSAYVCNVCDMSFSTQSSLTNHCDMHILKFMPTTPHATYNLLEEGEICQMSYFCYICCEKFSRKDMLEKHFLIHDEKNHIACKISRKNSPSYCGSFHRNGQVALKAKVPDTTLDSAKNNNKKQVASPMIIKIKSMITSP